MAWEVFNRDDVIEGHDVPFVSIGPHQISFNAVFVRTAAIKPNTFVTVHVDDENFRIGFEFHAEKRSNSFGLSLKRSSAACSCISLVQKRSWIGAVANLDRRNRRFTPAREGKLWVVQLCPAFEERRRANRPTFLRMRGIYRYVREDGEIVYIGRGEIRKRLSQPERQDWDFDRVEYSVVADPDQQVKWEDYWITRFKESNKGRRPIYNKIDGSCKEAENERACI